MALREKAEVLPLSELLRQRRPGRMVRGACRGSGGKSGAAPAGLRACRDCGRFTTDYRCENCLANWRKKHGVTDLEVFVEGDWLY